MLMAVSFLSPVSIHIMIPASLSACIVSGTPLCNLSSIPVAPKKWNKEKEETYMYKFCSNSIFQRAACHVQVGSIHVITCTVHVDVHNSRPGVICNSNSNSNMSFYFRSNSNSNRA